MHYMIQEIREETSLLDKYLSKSMKESSSALKHVMDSNVSITSGTLEIDTEKAPLIFPNFAAVIASNVSPDWLKNIMLVFLKLNLSTRTLENSDA